MDDAKISRHIATNKDSLKLQEAFERMHSWSKEWLLKLNIFKCKILSITRSTMHSNSYGLNTGGSTSNLERVEKMKDLELWLTKTSSFTIIFTTR